MAQNVFERSEKKYILTKAQADALEERLSGEMAEDGYGQYTISNLYYDTDSYDLIRASLEKPLYKEKLRLRSYGKAQADTPVFLELKKKYKGVVYKRREKLPYQQAKAFLDTTSPPGETQILREIDAFLKQHTVSPKVYLCYDRTALAGIKDPQFRVTFDTNIRFRQSELRLDNGTWGTQLISPKSILMEVKFLGAMPLWFSRALSELQIFPTSFSKYGTCYTQYILPRMTSSWGVAAGA